jgi:hypothetical protein
MTDYRTEWVDDKPITTFVCPTCGTKEVSRIASLYWGCLMCGTFCMEAHTPNMRYLHAVTVPKYYDYFLKLQQIVNDEESNLITKSAIKALQGLSNDTIE